MLVPILLFLYSFVLAQMYAFMLAQSCAVVQILNRKSLAHWYIVKLAH